MIKAIRNLIARRRERSLRLATSIAKLERANALYREALEADRKGRK